jgi:hypothetical protein
MLLLLHLSYLHPRGVASKGMERKKIRDSSLFSLGK